MSTKIPIYDSSNSARSPTYEYPSSKIPSRLPKLASKVKSETYPDVSDIFLARTEELLKSSRSKSGKKRRHTTNEEPKFDYPNSDSSNPNSIDLSNKRQNPHLPLKRSESPPPVGLSFDHYQCPRSFVLNEVDAGIGNRYFGKLYFLCLGRVSFKRVFFKVFTYFLVNSTFRSTLICCGCK